ncbi:MAG: RidA family protein [Ilumatobacter sp.]|uniref:RidA family protein n=1 Tax=Ilumatobacter sp. TaxID=1967498 RepID=UPI0026344ED5|nr:RidA family protein [Ilumatobacter sp.]MDJ0768114.1 RidA family protein [Ilumatobacter sp.]
MNREIKPGGIAPPAANYAHAVLSEGRSRWLHTSGVVPIRTNGEVPDAIGEQAEVVWGNIEAMLVQAAMEPTDIVSVTTYVVAGEDLAPVMATRDAFLGNHRAASTLVTVPALVRPEWKVEIAVVASAA